MSEVLVLVDHADGAVKKVALELLTAARALGEPSAVVVGTSGTAGKLKESLASYGAAKVYVAESEDAAGYLVTPKVDALATLVAKASPAAVLVAATAEGKEVSGRLAARLDSGLLIDVVGVNSDGTVEQSIFGGAFSVKAKAAKGTPIASFIGAPELLSALTDIASFSSGRVTIYSLLLVFYTAVVMVVVWICGRFRAFLERSQAPI